MRRYFFEVLAYGATDKNMSAYLAEFPKLNGEQARAHFHEGSEFVHVFSGCSCATVWKSSAARMSSPIDT